MPADCCPLHPTANLPPPNHPLFQNDQANDVQYYELDTTRPLCQQLAGKVLVEHPTLLVLLPRERGGYTILPPLPAAAAAAPPAGPEAAAVADAEAAAGAEATAAAAAGAGTAAEATGDEAAAAAAATEQQEEQPATEAPAPP